MSGPSAVSPFDAPLAGVADEQERLRPTATVAAGPFHGDVHAGGGAGSLLLNLCWIVFGGLELALHSSMTYVAIDDDFKPQPVPHFQPTTDEDKRLAAHDLSLKELRDSHKPLPLVGPLGRV